MISCKHCRKHFIAYINHDLSPKVRGRVAQHLDQCEACYALYSYHKRATNDLGRTMPLVGNHRLPPFDRVWAAVRRDATSRSNQYYPLRYGMAMLAITFLLLIPFALGRTNQVLAELPTQPAPLLRATPDVTTATEEGVSVAFEISQTPAPARLPSTLLLDAIRTP